MYGNYSHTEVLGRMESKDACLTNSPFVSVFGSSQFTTVFHLLLSSTAIHSYCSQLGNCVPPVTAPLYETVHSLLLAVFTLLMQKGNRYFHSIPFTSNSGTVSLTLFSSYLWLEPFHDKSIVNPIDFFLWEFSFYFIFWEQHLEGYFFPDLLCTSWPISFSCKEN